jgi:hypothetical protein
MYIFILSTLGVSFIALCFFKKKFWENRYLVLLISGALTLVITLTTNYITRGKMDTKIVSAWEKPIKRFYVNDSLVIDSSRIGIINDELGISDYIVDRNDTITPKRFTSFLIYGMEDKKSNYKIVYYDANKDKFDYQSIKDVYIASSGSENESYYAKKKLLYNPKPNKWVVSFSLPRIKTMVLYITRVNIKYKNI